MTGTKKMQKWCSPPLVLIKQQSEDGSLTELRRKGKRGIDGYMLDEGVLVHMIEVLAHTGIPQELLSDQGSVFIGQVNKELCRLLNIDKLRTTAYHPQTNGILERWHSCLKGMLRKLGENQEDWARLLKFCLLSHTPCSYRISPI